MVISCAAYNCSQRFEKGSKISFHSFPSDPELKKKWVVNMKRESFQPSKHSKICSKHFEPSCFDKERFGHPFLLKGSVPTIFEFPEHLNKKSSHRKPPKNRNTPGTSSSLPVPENDDTSTEEQTPSTENIPSTTGSSNVPDKYRKRKHYIGDFEETDMNSPQKAKRCLFKARSTIFSQRKRLKNLLKQNIRIKKKIDSLNSLVAHLQKELMINENAAAMLKASFSGPAEELFQKMLGNKKKQYSEGLRCFALTLHFYSSKAYDYVRKVFNVCLPHPRTIRKWYQHLDGSPDFTMEALAALKLKVKEGNAAGKPVLCSLIIDEMSIRNKIEWDGKATCGYVDMGTDIDDDSLPEAKEALVFLVNAINGHWKVPIAYFLIDSLSGEEKANLVTTALTILHDTGIHVVSLTFDGAASNLSMVKFLCLDIHHANKNTSFEHPVTKEPVFVFLDVCHMLKLVRNSLASLGTIFNSEGDAIKWTCIENLVEKQLEEGLTLATKIRKRHINWESEKMKVKLAAQTLSNSVAQALRYLKNAGYDSFKDCEATAEFVETFNHIFDILNSRNLLQKGFKCAFSPKTELFLKDFLTRAESYILQLSTSSSSDSSIFHSRKKTGFLGFLVCIRSCLGLYKYLVLSEQPKLKYLLLYKFSQDHLEVFFSAIRRRGGDNNNPTAAQFKAAYKRLLVHHEVKGAESSNCFALDQINILSVSSSEPSSDLQCHAILTVSQDRVADTPLIPNFDHDYCTHPAFEQLSPYVSDVVTYIAGFVVRKVECLIKCAVCLSALRSARENYTDYAFIKEKMYSKGEGLIVPSKDVIVLCKLTESELRNINVLKTKEVHQKVLCRMLRSVNGTLFNDIKAHLLDQEFAQSHEMDLVRLIVKCYVNSRMRHECAKEEEKRGRKKVRSVLNKFILFNHQ